MTDTLTDRYLAAVVRTVPERQRDDVARELLASIHDELDARTAAGEDPALAERAVLEELGDPDALAAGFADRPLHLIGPRYFLTWWRLLKTLLWIITPIATIGVIIGTSISGAGVGEVAGTAASVFFGVIIHLAFWTTLVFAVIERSGDQSAVVAWTLDDLPARPETGASRGDMIASLIVLAVTAVLVLWDHFLGAAYLVSAGGWVAFLHPGLWPAGTIALLAFLVIEAIIAVAVYAVGRWTTGLATLNAMVNVAFAVAVVWLLVTGSLLNPAFWPALIPEAESGATVAHIVTILIGVGVVAICAWDAIDGFGKAHRARR